MVILLYNPLSKNNRSKRVTKKLVDTFKKNNIEFRVKSLLKIKDLSDYITTAPKNIAFILLGGDGTINTFVNKTYDIHIKAPITLKKSGSGNDFLRSLKKQKSKKQYIMEMLHDDQTHYFMNGTGIGLDGLISHRVNLSPRKNRFNYFINTIKSFITFKPEPLNVTIDDKNYTFNKAYLININNGAYIGGGMKLTPKAKLSENKLDVIIVHRVPKIILVLIFISVYLGIHTLFKRYVFTTKATHVKATFKSKQIAQCDGETFPNTQTLEVKTTEKSLSFTPYKKRSF